MSFQSSGRGSSSSGSGGGSSGGAAKVQWNGGRGYAASGSGESFVAREMIEGPGTEIDDPGAIYGNTTFSVVDGHWQIGKATIDFTLPGPQKIGIMKGLEYVEITTVIFRLFSAQPTATLRGGVYTTKEINPFSELVPSTMRFDDWRGPRTSKRLAIESSYRKATGLWYIPSVVSDIPLTGEIMVGAWVTKAPRGGQ